MAISSDISAVVAAIHEPPRIGLDVQRHSVVWRLGSFAGEATGCTGLGDPVKFWDACGGLWSGLFDLPLGGLMITIPGFGAVLIGGYLANVIFASLPHADGAAVENFGLGALGVALAGLGLRRDDLQLCRQALENGDVFVVGDRSSAEAAGAGRLPRHADVSRMAVLTAADRLGRPSSHRPPRPPDHGVLDRSGPSDGVTLQELP